MYRKWSISFDIDDISKRQFPSGKNRLRDTASLFTIFRARTSCSILERRHEKTTRLKYHFILGKMKFDMSALGL
mgnify:CR=1